MGRIMWIIKSFFLALFGLLLTIIGLFVIPIGILFKREYPETKKEFTQYKGNDWMLVRLPKWLLPWDNMFDGMLGDKRGWWDNRCREKGRTCQSFLSMWLWTAIRNPTNYWSRVVTGVDVSKINIRTVKSNCTFPSENPGKREWVYLMAEDEDGDPLSVRRFFMSWAYPFDENHGIMIDIGWKIKPDHNNVSIDAPESQKIKGSVFTMSPWKNLN
jgi:hypothetical protein